MSCTRTNACIMIGGSISHEIAQQLVDIIADAGVAIDWCDDQFTPGSPADLAAAINDDGHLRLVDDQAAGGVFTEIEDVLVEHGIPFDRRSDAAGELDGEVVRHRPGLGTITRLADQGGEALVLAADMHKARVLLRTALEQRSPERVREALAVIDEVLGPEVPDLEPFIVVGQTA